MTSNYTCLLIVEGLNCRSIDKYIKAFWAGCNTQIIQMEDKEDKRKSQHRKGNHSSL